MTFIFFSCLIALAGTSGTILNKIGEGRHPRLIPDLGGRMFSLKVNCRYFTDALYQAEEVPPFFPVFRIFIINES